MSEAKKDESDFERLVMFVCPVCGCSRWGNTIRGGVDYGLCNGFRRMNDKYLRCQYSWKRT